ncbi:hypothetical protein SASPL_112717 [Salvia splendens]|uniref:Uncharacterized protein n=1 Tax=Salvia splendens TaxID=180675 RepID=A0A8X8YEE6_SALSN|nr:hypothetical protein SASPL_112717 [Salvia splendens]
MCQSPHHHKHMEDLVALPRQIEPPGPPPLGHPAQVKHGPDQIREGHDALVREYDIAVRVSPVDHSGMDGRDDAKQGHGDEEEDAEGAAFARGEGRVEEGDDGAGTKDGDPGEVDDLPVRGALEDVVHGGEVGGDDHDGDAHIVEVEELRVEAARVAAEEVAEAAAEEAEHGATQEHIERPAWWC